jgi:hypothetical protein
MNGQSYLTDFFLSKITEIYTRGIKYLRIPCMSIATEQESLIQLDVANKQAYDLMKMKAQDQALIFEKTEDIKNYSRQQKHLK